MQLTKLSILLSFTALALAGTPVRPRAPQAPQETPTDNANRPVPAGACCVANTNLRQDVCSDANGAPGRCVPANSAGCGAQLTCVADTELTCDPTQQDRGREKCVASG